MGLSELRVWVLLLGVGFLGYLYLGGLCLGLGCGVDVSSYSFCFEKHQVLICVPFWFPV